MTDTKVCTKCSKSKELSSFNKMKASKDGLMYACRDCHNIYKRAYRSSHPDKVAASHKAWREANRDTELARFKAYYEANPEKVAARVKAWQESNPDRAAAISGKRLAINRGGAASNIYDLDLCVPFYAESRRLSRETGVPHHVDHIDPIARGGLHCQTNLQVLTAKENIQKGDK